MSVQRPSLEAVIDSITQTDAQPASEQELLERHAAVLERAANDPRFQNAPVSLVCPGCGAILKRFHHGLPPRVGVVDDHCPECETTLKRWSVIGIHQVFEAAPTTAQLQRLTTRYWDARLWAGITTGDGNPRTDEYTRAFTEQAVNFGWDWTVTCPLCRRPLEAWDRSRPDYHHWRHEPDQGVCLCRPCHEALSGGRCDREQDWVAQRLGLKNKYDLQLTRLALREQAVMRHDSVEELVSVLCDRYNLIHTEAEVTALLSQTLNSSTVQETVDDEYLFASLPQAEHH